MSVAPLAIVQARMRSTRLPGKVMLPLADGRPILAHVVERATAAFGPLNVVVATGPLAHNREIVQWAEEHSAHGAFAWDGDENDVLGRFHACAHRYRWHPDSVIVRACCDDPFLRPAEMRRVAEGERLPVSSGGEAFTLAMLDAAHRTRRADDLYVCDDGRYFHTREHLTHALFPTLPPMPPSDGQVWTVDSQADYERAVERSRTEPPIGAVDYLYGEAIRSVFAGEVIRAAGDVKFTTRFAGDRAE